MKTKMKIFNVIFGLAMCLLPVCLRADDLSACDGYEYFSPAFALCTVHAYNIGDRTNPTSGARTAEMNDVIALKSTVIAQQLKEQYDLLNTMIKRFKTQLEKAVLTSKLEVITGNNSSSSGGGSSSWTNGGLARADDCAFESYEKVYDCLAKNMRLIQSEVDNDLNNARKQLENDIKVMDNESLCNEDSIDSCKKISACKNLVSKNDIKTCAATLYRKASKKSDDNEIERRRGLYGIK